MMLVQLAPTKLTGMPSVRRWASHQLGLGMGSSTKHHRTFMSAASHEPPSSDPNTSADVLLALQERASDQPKRVILPESEDPRVLKAAKALSEQRLCKPVVPWFKGIEAPAGVEVVDLEEPYMRSRILDEVQSLRNTTRDTANAIISKNNLVSSGMLLKWGKVDGAVAGSQASTANVIRAGIMTQGLAAGVKTVSSCFLMILPNGSTLTYADCGVVPDPTSSQLVDIAIASSWTHERLCLSPPKVALLSFSTHGSARHPRVDKMAEATRALKEAHPSLLCDGELQVDAAIVPSVSSVKAPKSPLKGRANVLIFPDLDSGNIAYKLTQRLAGAVALGPLIQGLEKPYLDLSRGCSVEDIVSVSCIASLLADPAKDEHTIATN